MVVTLDVLDASGMWLWSTKLQQSIMMFAIQSAKKKKEKGRRTAPIDDCNAVLLEPVMDVAIERTSDVAAYMVRVGKTGCAW